jgi:hypothetical protein
MNTLAHDINHLTAPEISNLYGVEFFEGPEVKTGKVFDPTSNKEFESIQEWAADQDQQEEWDDMSNVVINGRMYDEDYF